MEAEGTVEEVRVEKVEEEKDLEEGVRVDEVEEDRFAKEPRSSLVVEMEVRVEGLEKQGRDDEQEVLTHC